MNRRILSGLFVMTLGLATACGNPAIDPNATYQAQGRALDADGNPMAGTKVRMLKYWSDSRLLAPTTEQIFMDTPTGDDGLGFNIELVQEVDTDMTGNFSFEVLGSDIALPGGYTTSNGLQEGASIIIVVRDAMDPLRRSGTYTHKQTFSQSNAGILIGDLPQWQSGAVADLSNAVTTGLVKLNWNTVVRTNANSELKNQYRLSVEGESGNTARLIIRCREGSEVEGGCSRDPSDNNKLVRYLSAFSLYAFYADANGRIAAYIQADADRYRHVARFEVTEPLPDLTAERDPVGLDGLWAVGAGGSQELLNTRADDGDPKTREPIDVAGGADAIYGKLVPARVTDAGLLNSLVANASDACLVLEFSVTDYVGLAEAQASPAANWQTKGKFCGENGARNEMSALVSFDTTGADAVVAAWMRLRAVQDGGVASPSIDAVGEVAVYTPSP